MVQPFVLLLQLVPCSFFHFRSCYCYLYILFPRLALQYRLLSALCVRAGQVVRMEETWAGLLWGDRFQGDSGPLRAHVKLIRARLGDSARSSRYILTYPGVGYMVPHPD